MKQAETTIIGIAILFSVSLLVRIIPAFINLPFSEKTQEKIKFILPTAVFINLMTYCVITELGKNFVAATLSFGLLFGILTLTERIGLLTVVFTASMLFITLKYFFSH